MRRERGGLSRSGIDFRLKSNKTLSVKTNKNKSKKVCPPEMDNQIRQPLIYILKIRVCMMVK